MSWLVHRWRPAAITLFLLAWGLLAYWLCQQVTHWLLVFLAWHAPRWPTRVPPLLVWGPLYSLGIFLAYCSALLLPLGVLLGTLTLVSRVVALAEDLWPTSDVIDAEWTLPAEERQRQGYGKER